MLTRRALPNPDVQVVPVGVPERFGDAWIRVRWVVDVVVEVGADGNGLERYVGEVDERLRRQARLRDRVVLEVELGRELQELGPVGAAAGAHGAGTAGG